MAGALYVVNYTAFKSFMPEKQTFHPIVIKK